MVAGWVVLGTAVVRSSRWHRSSSTSRWSAVVDAVASSAPEQPSPAAVAKIVVVTAGRGGEQRRPRRLARPRRHQRLQPSQQRVPAWRELVARAVADRQPQRLQLAHVVLEWRRLAPDRRREIGCAHVRSVGDQAHRRRVHAPVRRAAVEPIELGGERRHVVRRTDSSSARNASARIGPGVPQPHPVEVALGLLRQLGDHLLADRRRPNAAHPRRSRRRARSARRRRSPTCPRCVRSVPPALTVGFFWRRNWVSISPRTMRSRTAA